MGFMVDAIEILSRYSLSWLFNPIFILRKRNIVPWKPNIHHVELEITTMCSRSCLNCDRSIRQAPSKEHMSVGQVERFIEESFALDWRWKRIGILGGEPTLHPQFFRVLDVIGDYKKKYPRCRVELTTNGCGAQVEEVLAEIPAWVEVWNSAKTSNVNDFVSYNVAPDDLEEYQCRDFSQGCWITNICGLGLSRYGFYPCGAGASLDRVFGFDIGVKSLRDVNVSKMQGMLPLLCRLCGHFKENYGTDLVTDEEISRSWKRAYKNYQVKKPKLSLY